MAANALISLERAKGFEPSTPTLARLCSTPELHPHPRRLRRRRWALMAQAARDCNTPSRPYSRFHLGPCNGETLTLVSRPVALLAAIAQMVRALDCGSRGPPFDPGWRYQCGRRARLYTVRPPSIG